MNYQSPGSAIVQGIEAGQNFMFRAQQESDRRAQLQIQSSREDRRDRMEQARIDFMERNETDKNKREAWKEANDAHKTLGEELTTEGAALRERFTGPDGKLDMNAANADPAYQNYKARTQKWNMGRDALDDAVMGPFLKQGIDRAKEYGDGLVKQNDPKFDISDPANAQDLHHMVSACTKQDPANFLQGPNGEPSAFEQAAQQIHSGFTNNNAQELYTGASSILGNQFEAGRLGYMDALGGRVTSATLSKDRPFVPTPDGQAVHPVIETGGETDDGFTKVPYAAPTVAGFDHPDKTDLVSFTPKKVLDNIGAMGAMQKLLSHPQIQTNLARACQNPDQYNQDFAQVYTARGNKPSLGGIIDHVENPDGSVDHVYRPYTHGGGVGPAQPISHSAPKPAAPKAVPEAIQEANQVVADKVENPDTPGLPYTSAGQYLASKRGISAKPNEASIKLQAEIEGELAEARAGQIKSPVSNTGYTDAIKRDGSGEPILDEDGKPQIDKAIQSQIDRHIKGLETKLESVRKGFTEQGRAAPPGPATTTSAGQPLPNSPEGQKATDWITRAKKDPRNAGRTDEEIFRAGQANGKVPKGWMRTTPPGVGPNPSPGAPPAGRGIQAGL